MKTLGLFTGCLVLGFAVALGLRASFGGESPAPPETAPATPSPPKKESGLLVDLGNELCPINEGEVDGSTYVEWTGMRVGFCCPGCDTKFLDAPEASLEKAGIEWKPLHDAIEAYRDAPPEHKAHALDRLRGRWTVVREP